MEKEFINVMMRFKKIKGIYNSRLLNIVRVINLPLNNPKLRKSDVEDFNNLIEIKHRKPLGAEYLRIKNKYIAFKKKIRNFKGFRHLYGLSVRGQNTRNNCATQKRKIK